MNTTSTSTTDEAALRFVMSQNLHRRHLTASDHALVGLRSLPHYERIAKAKQIEHGGTAPGKKAEEKSVGQRIVQLISEESEQPEMKNSEKPKQRAPRALDMAAEATGAKRLREEAP